jgi:hypothetical protein
MNKKKIKVNGVTYCSLMKVYNTFKNDKFTSYTTFLKNYYKNGCDIEKTIAMDGRATAFYAVEYKGVVYYSLKDLSKYLYPRHKANRLLYTMRKFNIDHIAAINKLKKMDALYDEAWIKRKDIVKNAISANAYKFLYKSLI